MPATLTASPSQPAARDTRRPAPRKPATALTRVLKILEPVGPDGRGIVQITQQRGTGRAEIDFYGIQTFPAYDGSSTGVRVENTLDRTVYEVCLGATKAGSTCTCLGHTHHGRCKHVDSLLAMKDAGKLPLPAVHDEGTTTDKDEF